MDALRSRILFLFFPAVTICGSGFAQTLVQQGGPYIWDDGCGDQIQVSVSVYSSADLYWWYYSVSNISATSGSQGDSYVNGLGGFEISFPQAMNDLGNITPAANWSFSTSANSDGTTLLSFSSNWGYDPDQQLDEPIYALQPGQSMQLSFTTLPRQILDVQACGGGSLSSCAEAGTAAVLVLSRGRRRPSVPLLYCSNTRPLNRAGRGSPRLVRVQSTSCLPLSGEVLLAGPQNCQPPTNGAFSDAAPAGNTNSITIVTPANGQSYQLTDANFTATTLQFLANSLSNGPISWTAALQYQPSQGTFGPYTDNRSFNSTIATSTPQTYSGIGGQLQTTVSAQTCPPAQASSTSLITGSKVPDTTIKSYLLALYANDANMATPNLLVQIAEKESSLRQFCTVQRGCPDFQDPLYGSNGPWPIEGSLITHHDKPNELHIGLMQVDVTAGTAWNWQTNADAGDQTLDDKFTYVQYVVAKLQSVRPGLMNPTPRQMEDMAIMQYGDSPAHSWDGLYWVASCGGAPPNYHQKNPVCLGTWGWIMTTRNLKGVKYVNDVRNEP
jgi:hypothetical protein